MDSIAVILRQLDPAVLLRAFYLAASALILLIQAVPALKFRFLAYGSRATSPESKSPPKGRPVSNMDQFLDYLASIQVPHSWFTHFYLLSVLCSLFWGYIAKTSQTDVAVEVKAAWLLMLLQGVRRMLESYTYSSSSTSKMWFGHWALGLLFYLTVNISIWIEGISNQRPQHDNSSTWTLAIFPPFILACQALQHSYHAYLYRLRTENAGYQLPKYQGNSLLCLHYTCEVGIYFGLAFLAAPGEAVNWTVWCAAIFVAVNLGVTAKGTKEWYERRFGVKKLRGRKMMVPYLW